VVVTGYDDGFSGRNFRTRKYFGEAGYELWTSSFSSTTPNSHDTGLAVAFGTGGHVFVTGATGNTSQTIKYNGLTGDEIWSVPSNLPEGQWAAIAVDAAGNPAVVGSSRDALGTYDIRTVKYNGTTGAQIWNSAFNGSKNAADFGAAIAIDADGNVIVTGTSFDNVGGRNIRTIKYDGTTGAEIWSHVYIGPSGFDFGLQVGVGPDNTVYVVGILDQYSSQEVALVQKLSAVGAPGAPIILGATPGYGQFSLSFSPPDSNGGAAVTQYNATCTASGQPTLANSAAASPILVTAATVGVAYACTITATNSGGTGSPSFSVAASALAPAVEPGFTGALSRKSHGGTPFDLVLSSVATNPTTEPRLGPSHNVVFVFDRPVTAGTATVTAGTATAGTPTFSGNEMTVPLTDVANQQYVTVTVTGVNSADGGTGGSASIRIGYLAGDVNQNRAVTLSDLGQVNAQIAQPVTAANYLKDVNASGTLSLADKGVTNTQLTKVLPAP
jgi:hypothetical protein